MAFSSVKIEKLLTVPTAPLANQFYLVEDGVTAELYLSDSSANLILLNDGIGITGTGTLNYLPSWDADDGLVNSPFYVTPGNVLNVLTDFSIHSGTKRFYIGDTPDSYILVSASGQNIWHANPYDISIETAGTAYFGDPYTFGNGGYVGVISGDALELNSLSVTTIGDTQSAANSTQIIVNDLLETISLEADLGVTVNGNNVLTTVSGIPASQITSGTLAAARMPALTGDVTTVVGTVATTITANAVTYSKIQAISTTSKLLGSSSTTTPVQEITIGSGLSMSGTTLSATGGGGSVTSVGLTNTDGLFDISGSPVTTAGSLSFGMQDATDNTVLAGAAVGPTGGSTPVFRALVVADIPNLPATKLTSGTLSATVMPALTGDVTTTAGAVATTIANNAVTLAKMATMATASILGRNTAGTGNVEVLSASTVKTLLSLNNVENTALSTWAGTANITTLGTITTGTWLGSPVGILYGGTGATTANAALNALLPAQGASSDMFLQTDGLNASWANPPAQTVTLTGNVTGSGTGSFATTIANNAVTYAKIQAVSAVSKLLGSSSTTTPVQEITIGTGLSLTGTTLTAAGSGGTVTSVELAAPAEFLVTGSPTTTTGVLTLEWEGQPANKIFAGPTTGVDAVPTFRSLVAADIPNLAASKITSGTMATARLGSGTADATTFLRGDQTWANPLTIAKPVAGGGANQVLYQDGSSNLLSSSAFTYASSNLTVPKVTIASNSQALVLGSTGQLTAYGNCADTFTDMFQVDSAKNYAAYKITAGSNTSALRFLISSGSQGFFQAGEYAPSGQNGSLIFSGMNAYDANDVQFNAATVWCKGTFGVGLTTGPAAQLEVRGTTEQIRASYDSSNRMSLTVGSTGGVTFDAVGSGALFTFSDPVVARVRPRTGTTTSSATPTINTDNVDFYSLTAQAVDITSFTTNLSGTPTENQPLNIAITGTAARLITWGASFENGAVTLPTTTVTTNRLDVAFRWNSVASKWRCMASG